MGTQSRGPYDAHLRAPLRKEAREREKWWFEKEPNNNHLQRNTQNSAHTLAVRNTLKCSLKESTGWSVILFRNLSKAFLLVSTNSSEKRSTTPFTTNFSGSGWDGEKWSSQDGARKTPQANEYLLPICPSCCLFLSFFLFFFEIGSQVVQPSIKLTLYLQMTLNSFLRTPTSYWDYRYILPYHFMPSTLPTTLYF